jgi:excisionase family DNA binding protein
MNTPKRGRPAGPVPFKPAASDAEFLTVAQAADRLQCCTNTILRYIRGGKLTASRVSAGGPYRIAAVALDKMMDDANTMKEATNGDQTH